MDFGLNRSGKLGRANTCKQCATEYRRAYALKNPEKIRIARLVNNQRYRESARKSHLWKQYGLTEAHFISLLIEQGYKCAICKDATKLFVDHNHTTNQVRGLLCSACNSAIGFLKDNREHLKAAMEYLEYAAIREESNCRTSSMATR